MSATEKRQCDESNELYKRYDKQFSEYILTHEKTNK